MLIAEAVIGRLARSSPQTAAGVIANRYGFSRGWNIVGWTGALAGFLVTSYYTMIAGWVLAYTVPLLLRSLRSWRRRRDDPTVSFGREQFRVGIALAGCRSWRW
jgi:SNF family Na+-dependent transporter